MNDLPIGAHAEYPLWATGSRLLRLGESIAFHLHLPPGIPAGELSVFPRYLELAEPGDAFQPGGDLDWLGALPCEAIDPGDPGTPHTVTYTPREPGNYLARWRVAGEHLYRYFSVIEDDWIVLRFSTFARLESEPTLHGTGIPLDYRLSAAQFEREDQLFQRLYGYHRLFGDGLIPFLPDMPTTFSVSDAERTALYRLLLEKSRSVMPSPEEIRSARVEMNHPVDPGYARELGQLGIRDQCGLQEANAKPWLGMPEFPYFASPIDCRKPNQGPGGPVVAHQWDFCGGFHFLGPVGWHYQAAEGDWGQTDTCLRQGMEELRDLAGMSGHPAFAYPLYEGVTDRDGSRDLHRFVERFQRSMAFEMPKAFNIAYARSIDIADYYTRHFPVTPRTVFVSRTDHVHYDKRWLCHWNNDRLLLPQEMLSPSTRISSIHARRRESRYYKDPLSCEYIQVEDQARSMRFEYACPNPIWWFDYTEQERGPVGSTITHTETPDVEVRRSGWERKDRGWNQTVVLETTATFPDYAIALWDMPEGFDGDPANVRTNARECIVAWNRDRAYRLVLLFDLVPDLELQILVSS